MPSDPRSALTVVRALLDGGQAPSDPLVKAAQVMLSGFGYNFYDAANVARANDQLVRARASGLLTEAAQLFVRLESAFREAHVPPSTREQPFPPADAMRTLRSIEGARRRLHDLSSTILTLETPGSDRIWGRLRSERELLERLLAADIALIGAAQDTLDAAKAVHADSVPEQLPAVEGGATRLESALGERRTMLSTVG